jgi:hypothetical protein
MYRQNFDQKKQDLERNQSNLKNAMGILIEKLNSVITKYKQLKKSNIYSPYEIERFQEIPYFKSANLVNFKETKYGFTFTVELIPDVNKKYLYYKVFYRQIEFSINIEKNTMSCNLRLSDINKITLSLYHFVITKLEDDTSLFLLDRNDIEKIIYAITFSVRENLVNENGIKHEDLNYRRNTLLGYLAGLKEKYFTESNTSLSNFIFNEEI